MAENSSSMIKIEAIVREEKYEEVKNDKSPVWHESIRLTCPFVFLMEEIMKKVAFIMGSDSDLPIVEKGINMLDSLGVPYEVHVYSAHRTPVEAINFSLKAEENGFGVLICAAGMAAHLAGVIAANTTLPVIGIPCKSSVLDGMDALLATVMMPTGIPVATVAINGGANSALLAAQIIALGEPELAKKLKEKRLADSKVVLEKDANVSAKYSK